MTSPLVVPLPADADAPGIWLPVREAADVVVVRIRARRLATAHGFRAAAAGAIETAVSEVARNILVHARAGALWLSVIEHRGRRGLAVIARDEGPGIADCEQALTDGYSTSSSLGLGLPSARRLMDEFMLDSRLGAGTDVHMIKWVA
jgi:serine/threonine-protein kinase RsbT